MLDDTVEVLTKQMLESAFEDKKNKQEAVIKMTKIELYQFCIKLIKVIKETENIYGG